MFPLHPSLKSQSGTTLLETVIASAIIVTGVAMIATVLSTQSRAAKQLDDRFTAAELANSMLEHVDCPETIHRVCVKGDGRLFSASGPLNFGVPYAVDNFVGKSLDVTCLGGVVDVRYRGADPKAPPLIPGGICVRRFTKAKQCYGDYVLGGIDDESGKITCVKRDQ